VKLRLDRGLLLTQIRIEHQGQTLELSRVLVDTGSSGTLFPVSKLAEIGIGYALEDRIAVVRGVGGSETVFSKTLERITMGEATQQHFTVEVGDMDYGVPIDGILGVDFLRAVRVVLDLDRLEASFAKT
jgi:predicted aspartyl protease